MANAKSITADKLNQLTKQAVRTVTTVDGVAGKFSGKGVTMGFVLSEALAPADQLTLASEITTRLNSDAAGAGAPGLGAKPLVVVREGRVTVGFLAPELRLKVR
jgi:hypothetical protein